MVLIGVWSHAGYQNVSPGLGKHVGKFFLWPIAFPAKLNLLVFYSIFIDFELRESKISRYCQFGRPIWPSSNESPDFSLFENIQNLAQLLLVPELSLFTSVSFWARFVTKL